MKRILILTVLLFNFYANAGLMKSLGKAIVGAGALGANAVGAGLEYGAEKEQMCGTNLNTFNMNYNIVMNNVNNDAYNSESSFKNDYNKLIEQGTELIREIFRSLRFMFILYGLNLINFKLFRFSQNMPVDMP